jgi:tetraacyldisaccharide 4'-kinase
LLDLIYGQVAGSRRRWFERHPEARRRLQQPVISVGNLSVGGTGKTPLVAQLAEWLLDRHERPAILSRGYKRAKPDDGVTVVCDGSSTLADVDRAGDEPLMLARQVPRAIVCVADDRHLAGVVAERALGATVHLLDDGFQHVQLARDFDILVTSPGEITTGRVLPRGRLRETRGAAARAHFAVIVGADDDSARTEAWELGIAQFSAATRRLDAGALGLLAGESAVAVAGIGAPGQFAALLRDSGVLVKDVVEFPDHHRYTVHDIGRIERARQAAAATLVLTTEKDAVRFEAAGRLPFQLIPVAMHLELHDWPALTGALQHVLAVWSNAA